MTQGETPQFQDLVAIVTGGGTSPGPTCSIGEATSRLLGRRGCRVVVADINAESAAETVRQIVADGGEAVPATADLSREDGCRQAVEHVMQRFGRLDILVNNLGVADGGAVTEIDELAWDRGMAVNLESALFLSKYAIPQMLAGGAIVNVSSTTVDKPSASVVYSASKGALEALTKQIAVQHGPDGVRCNAVRPGEVWTDMVARRCENEEQAELLRDARRKRTALRREGDAWDVAEAIVFLASPQARWITAQILTVDGGSAFVPSSVDWTTRVPTGPLNSRPTHHRPESLGSGRWRGPN